MNDTSPAQAAKYHALLMQRSGEERLKMGCSMLGAAKEIVRSSILEKDPGISKQEMRRMMLLRIYEKDLKASFKQRILSSL